MTAQESVEPHFTVRCQFGHHASELYACLGEWKDEDEQHGGPCVCDCHDTTKTPLESGNSARGNDRNTNNHEGETTMNDVTSVPTAPTFAELCPVIGCDKTEDEHESADPQENLHTHIGGGWDLDADAYPVMDFRSWPRWVLYFDAFSSVYSSDDFFAILEGVEEQRKLVVELNEAIVEVTA